MLEKKCTHFNAPLLIVVIWSQHLSFWVSQRHVGTLVQNSNFDGLFFFYRKVLQFENMTPREECETRRSMIEDYPLGEKMWDQAL